MVQPLVSVVIPNYNYGRYLSQAINSVLGQSYPNIEIIVVDDGSTDESAEVLALYANHIRVVKQRNRGVSVARNAGAELAIGDFLAFLDADDVWMPTKLQRQIEYFQRDPELGLVHCGMVYIDSASTHLHQCLDGREGWIAEKILLFESAVLGAGSTAVVPCHAYKKVGGFDTNLSTSADWDFCYRVAYHWKIGFVPEILVGYRMHGSNMHGNVAAMEHDTLYTFNKVFSSADPRLCRLRRRAYGKLHMLLAGSFFRAGRRDKFIEHTLKSIWFTPYNCRQLYGYPLRQWQRHQDKMRAKP
jgi:glycosyltransferase involved in cell wall biosynthesis